MGGHPPTVSSSSEDTPLLEPPRHTKELHARISASPPIYHRQPARALWLISQILFLPTLYLYWHVRYFLRSARPLPSWPLRRAVGAQLIRWATKTFYMGNALPRWDISQEPNERELAQLEDYRARFVWIDPVDIRELVAPLRAWAEHAGVQGVRIRGYWVGEEVERPARGRATVGRSQADILQYREMERREREREALGGGEGRRETGKVMLFLHGGSYITGSAHPSDFTSFLPGNSIHHSHKLRACLSVDYRLSSASPNPLANPFPAALLDALSGFRYLLSLGISPGEIIIAGDSAGGNLALALCKYLVEAESLGPVLGGLVLLSPWSDLTDSHHYPDCSLYRNYKTDYLLGLEESMGSYSVHAYCGGVSPWCPWISPGSLRPGEPFPGSEEERAQIYVGAEDWDDASFLHWPRTLLIPGSVEMIIDEIRTLKGKMMRDRVRLTYREWEGCPHDFMTMWFMEPERTQMLRFIGAWIDGEVNEEIATGETTD